jgi:AcrR family transcriptional regulator
MSGKPGRPPEDRLLRQREIYQAVAPLLLSVGVRRLTMRQAARAACISLGGLSYYFPTKQDLVLHGVQPAAAARLCLDFHAVYGLRKQVEPRRFLELWTEFVVDWIAFVRPSVQAALELGQETFRHVLEQGINAGLDDLAESLDLLVPTSNPEGMRVLARRLQRSLFAACIDQSLPLEDVREELLTAPEQGALA